nr:hypothetical protein [uncultured Draconibacterium sp.]
MKHKHSIGFSPNYTEIIDSKVKPRIYIEIAKKAYEELDWELLYEIDTELNGIRQNDLGRVTEKISVKITDKNKIQIQSKSENGFWDFGKNSKRVKKLIETTENKLNKLSADEISEIEKATIAKDNWDDYIVPDTLTEPKKYREPIIIIPIIGYLLLSTGLGFVISFLSISSVYVIGLFEVVVGFILAYSLKLFMPLSNYTHSKNLLRIIFITIVLTYFLNQYFQYLHFKQEYSDLTFLIFISERLKHGFMFKALNLGTIGLIVFWIVQIGLTFLIALLKCFKVIMNYSIARVPDDVINYAMYLMAKDKHEREIKIELSKKGWKTDLEQSAVFEAIGWIYEGQQYNRNV